MRLLSFASQVSKPAANLLLTKCWRKGQNMSEQKQGSFMAELDGWSEANVIGPLYHITPLQEEWDESVAQVKKAIRAKVLESYRNGQAAGPRKVFKR